MARNTSQEGRGPSQRQLRVGELIRRRLSEILTRGEIHDPDLNRLYITVGEVRVSPDLRIATCYLMPLGGGKEDEMFELLKRNKGEIRKQVSKDLKLKLSPELRFRTDDTFDRLEESRRLFDNDAVRRDVEGD
jgi:ribosome-binding factor A